MGKSVSSPLRYPGGKFRAASQILARLPFMSQALCSPFIGGGSVEIAFAHRGGRVAAGDAYEPLVNFWEHLLRDASSLAAQVRHEMFWPMSKEKFAQTKKEYGQMAKDVQAAAFYALNRASFSGTTFSGGYSEKTGRFTESAIAKLEAFRAPNLTVRCGDYEGTIEDNPDMPIYMDPPYVIETGIYGNKGDQHEDFSHERLAAFVRRLRVPWVMSYNDCPLVRQLYPEGEYTIEAVEWNYGMSNVGTQKASNEILITPSSNH